MMYSSSKVCSVMRRSFRAKTESIYSSGVGIIKKKKKSSKRSGEGKGSGEGSNSLDSKKSNYNVSF